MITASRGLCGAAVVLFIVSAVGVDTLGPVDVTDAGLACFSAAFIWWGWGR